MTNDTKNIINTIIENEIDSFMEANDFKRRRRSINYIRKTQTVTQKSEMICFSHPSYHPGAIMHIYPWMSIYFPKINRLAAEIVKDVRLLPGNTKSTIRQPIQIYVKSEPIWVIESEDDYEPVKQKIYQFLRNYTIPLLNNLKSISDYIELLERNDKRIMAGEPQAIYLVCAYILQYDYDKAMKALGQHFGKKGLQSLYASVFLYLENIIKTHKSIS